MTESLARDELVASELRPPAGVPCFDHDPYSDDVGHFPYPYYKKMREAGPVCWLSRYGVYVSTRDVIVRQCLGDWQHFSSAKGIGPHKKRAINDLKGNLISPSASGLLEYDPPQHGPARRIMVSLLSNQAVAALRNSFAVAADALVDELLQRGSADAVTEVVHRFILSVVGDAVGLPKEGRQHLLIFGELAMNLPGPHNDRYQRALARVEKEGSRAWIASAAGREALAPGGFGATLYATADRGEITHAEAAALIGTFLFAAVDSTAMTLINGLHCFAAAPDQWLALRANPGQVRQAFDEVLRYRSAPQTLFRTTTCEVDIEGVRIPQDQKIGFSLAGANRDPARWHDPDKFDISRRSAQHVAFGAGIHACLGQMLARLEAECLLAALVRGVRQIELAADPVPFANNAMSSYSSLPLRFIPA